MTCYLFDPESLPAGFRFPRSFLDIVEQEPVPDLHPWWFLCKSQKDAYGWMLAVRRLYPSRQLVPFALWAGSDDIACFDGSGASEDPMVYYVHAYASPGWEDRGRVSNFAEWLKAAEQESAAQKAEANG